MSRGRSVSSSGFSDTPEDDQVRLGPAAMSGPAATLQTRSGGKKVKTAQTTVVPGANPMTSVPSDQEIPMLANQIRATSCRADTSGLLPFMRAPFAASSRNPPPVARLAFGARALAPARTTKNAARAHFDGRAAA